MHSSSDTKRQGVYRHMLTTLISIITYPTRLQNSCISSRLSYRTSPAGNGSLQPTLGSRPVLRGSPESSLPPKRAPDGLFPAFTTISCRPLLILRVGLAEGCQAAAGGGRKERDVTCMRPEVCLVHFRFSVPPRAVEAEVKPSTEY